MFVGEVGGQRPARRFRVPFRRNRECDYWHRTRSTPEEKCQAGKNTAAGRFAACLQNAEAKLTTTGDLGKYAQAQLDCSYDFATKWLQLERSAAQAGAT
jgi:hypothetical protein